MFRIWSVALYEAKLLLRNWAFISFVTIVSILLIAMLAAAHNAYYYRAAPALIPLGEFGYLSFFLAGALAILVPEMLSKGYLTHISRILYTRPLSNTEFIIGKFIGLLVVFFGFGLAIDIAITAFTIVFIPDTPVNAIVFVAYPFFILFPMIVFLLGLALFLDATILNKSISTMLLMMYVGLMTYSLDNDWYHLLDFRGVWLPILHSDFAGFGGLREVILLRGMYILLGCGLVCLAVVSFRRPPQGRRERIRGLAGAILCVAGMCVLGHLHLSGIEAAKTLRMNINTINHSLSDAPRVTPRAYRIDFVHHGREIEVAATLHFMNQTPGTINRYIFSLNPGLKVTEVRSEAGKLPFDRRFHVVTVTPVHPLAPRGADSLTILYRGSIDERACYTDLPDEERDMDNVFDHCVIARRYAFIQPRCVLLTREALWYPVPGTPKSGEEVFSRFEVTVKTAPGLTAISQGSIRTSGRVIFMFSPEMPLPRISLAIGPYLHRKIVVDGIEYGLYFLPGHDYFSNFYRGLSLKTLVDVIRESRRDIETNIGLEYPFSRFSIVETPVQFLAHPRMYSHAPETVQPEQVFFPERGTFLWDAGFRDLSWIMKSDKMSGVVRTADEIRRDTLREFFKVVFLTVDPTTRTKMRQMKQVQISQGQADTIYLSGSPYAYDLCLFPQFFTFRKGVDSGTSSPFGLALGYYLESKLPHRLVQEKQHFATPDAEWASRALRKNSLAEILADPARSTVSREVLQAKSEMFLSYIRAQADIPPERFDNFLREYMEQNRFQTVSSNDLAGQIQKKFGVDISAFLDQCMNAKTLPRYEISGLQAWEIPSPGGMVYNLRFTVYNPEPVEGVLYSRLFLPENTTKNDERYIHLSGGQAKEVGLASAEKTDALYFDTFLSQHIPRTFTQWAGKMKTAPKEPVFVGERIVSAPRSSPDSVIIIVDDSDPGFRILSGPKLKLLESVREKYFHRKKFTSTVFDDHYPPKFWSIGVDNNFYGLTEHSARYVQAGNGDQRVRWEANIPEEGTYDLYYYNLYYFQQYVTTSHPFIQDLHFKIGHQEGTAEIELGYQEGVYPWSYLGTFPLNRGPAWVELSDKTKGKLVYADAVKWVRKTNGTTDGRR